MLLMIERFIITFIIVFCLFMIYFFFKNKSKKYSKLPTTAMIYLINNYGIDIYSLGISYVEKHISLINSFIVSIDLLLYFYMDSLILKIIIMFAVTLILIFISYSLLARYYRKILNR